MGDARKYPEIRAARFQYAMLWLWLPRKIRADYGLRRAVWIDNNLSYIDAELLELYLEEDYDYMRFTWPEYHYKHACRLGICPNYLFDREKNSCKAPHPDVMNR
eukprot:scaffold29659_cov112-Isochrysis_galbana.AAC.1